MKIGVCGIACEVCPTMVKGKCPNGPEGCRPKENRMCAITTCAFRKGVDLCFRCPEFPCETTKSGPISYGYCLFISGKAFDESASNKLASNESASNKLAPDESASK